MTSDLKTLHTRSATNRLDDVFETAIEDRRRLIERVRESVHIKCHFQLLMWLQGKFQRCIPHQIFVAAWGDFSQGLVQHDIVSALPSVRSGPFASKGIRQFISSLFETWTNHGGQPFGYSFDDLKLGTQGLEQNEYLAYQAMRSVLVHGIRDERSRQDCLYVFLNADSKITPWSLDNMRTTLPFVDAALRQVAHLPCQCGLGTQREEKPEDLSANPNMSARETEIMEWVKMGKTNYEIGIILNISTFTVKNHLQRIFRKLEVSNRTQASIQVRELVVTPPQADRCINCPRPAGCAV